MAKYVKHPTDERKFHCPLCDYGVGEGEGKSRQAVSAHFNSTHKENEKSPSTPTLEADNVESLKVEEKSKPDWLKFDMTDEETDVETISISPLAQSFIKGLSKEGRDPSTPKELKQYYQHQGKMLTWIFTGVIDPLVSWYGKTITTDPSFNVARSNADVQILEETSSQWLEYRQISLPVTPDIVMAATVGSLYIPAFHKIHKNRDPSRPSLFKRWRQRRALKKALKKERIVNA